jgi:hypothetical protein
MVNKGQKNIYLLFLLFPIAFAYNILELFLYFGFKTRGFAP